MISVYDLIVVGRVRSGLKLCIKKLAPLLELLGRVIVIPVMVTHDKVYKRKIGVPVFYSSIIYLLSLLELLIAAVVSYISYYEDA